MRNLSLAGADRFSTSSCWRRNAISASRTACDLNKSDEKSDEQFYEVEHPGTRVAHRRLCTTPGDIFGRDR